MEQLLNVLTPHLVEIALLVLSGLGAYLSNKLKRYFNIKEVERIIKATVSYVEEMGHQDLTLQGRDKYNLALEKSSQWLNDKGLKVNEIELNTLILAFVNELREEK